MGAKIFKVDSFAEKPFSGNPAGVCVLPAARDEMWMQNVAREMNLSETAFAYRMDDGFDLRWFTPAVEVELCGHATLATAHILWESGALAPNEQARFQTKSGILTAERRGETVELDFPATPEKAAPAPPGLIEALGVKALYTGRNAFDCLVEVESEGIVRAARPDIARLKEVQCRGVIVTAASGSRGFDFVSRFFAPAVGVDEDPVTGSAHCCLGPYWSKKLGKAQLTAYQASSRGGIVHVAVGTTRVRLGGKAVTVLRGELAV
jgi:PhzF family phenazine biosynthesis protein